MYKTGIIELAGWWHLYCIKDQSNIVTFSPWKLPNMTEYNATQNTFFVFKYLLACILILQKYSLCKFYQLCHSQTSKDKLSWNWNKWTTCNLEFHSKSGDTVPCWSHCHPNVEHFPGILLNQNLQIEFKAWNVIV